MLLSICGGAIVAVVISSFFPDAYEASVSLRIDRIEAAQEDQAAADAFFQVAYEPSPQEKVTREGFLVALIEEADVARQWQLTDEAILQKLKSAISAEASEDGRRLSLRVRLEDAALAKSLVERVALSYREAENARREDDLQAQLDALRSEIETHESRYQMSALGAERDMLAQLRELYQQKEESWEGSRGPVSLDSAAEVRRVNAGLPGRVLLGSLIGLGAWTLLRHESPIRTRP
ncbi:MAG: hypothetical protein Q7Q71_13395 [Verrucomicrobiota bacterium JB023]|nr:hypothetical protein [Verrucomicrobiota bacterium JB023]